MYILFKIKTMRSKYFLKCWPSQPPGSTYRVIVEPHRTFKINTFCEQCTIGWGGHYGVFWSKKCSKVRSYFSVKKLHLSKWSDLWASDDPDFWPKKLQRIFKKENLQILGKTFGKARSGFFVWWGFLASGDKKLKRATLTEAPFMLKSNFWNYKYFYSNICATIPW